jgi:hypothetical protein
VPGGGLDRPSFAGRNHENGSGAALFPATLRAAEIVGQLLDADPDAEPATVGVDRDELTALLPLLKLERFDRRGLSATRHMAMLARRRFPGGAAAAARQMRQLREVDPEAWG